MRSYTPVDERTYLANMGEVVLTHGDPCRLIGCSNQKKTLLSDLFDHRSLHEQYYGQNNEEMYQLHFRKIALLELGKMKGC